MTKANDYYANEPATNQRMWLGQKKLILKALKDLLEAKQACVLACVTFIYWTKNMLEVPSLLDKQHNQFVQMAAELDTLVYIITMTDARPESLTIRG